MATEASPEGAPKRSNPHFAVLALVSFVAAFVVARAFTILNPHVVVLVDNGGIHIHHFWYGLALLAVGGWIGIVNQDERVDRWAAVLFGVGSGLIADEFGLLLTFGNYWTTLTYTVVAVLLVVLCLLYYFVRHASTLHAHFARMSRNEAFFMLGAFLAIIAGTFLSTMYDNAVVFTAALVLAIAAVAVLVYPIYNHLAQRRITAPKPESD